MLSILNVVIIKNKFDKWLFGSRWDSFGRKKKVQRSKKAFLTKKWSFLLYKSIQTILMYLLKQGKHLGKKKTQNKYNNISTLFQW